MYLNVFRTLSIPNDYDVFFYLSCFWQDYIMIAFSKLQYKEYYASHLIRYISCTKQYAPVMSR